MALDLYAGSLARYYTQDWENVVERYARESGQEYQKIGPGTEGPPPTWDEVAQGSQQWLTVINEQLAEHIEKPITWSEEKSSVYFTDRPGYDAWGALVTAAAYTVAGKDRPKVLREDWLEDPVVIEAMETKESGKNRFIMITCSGLWLPADFKFTFDFVDVCNEPINISSTGLLLTGLNMLNDETLKLDQQALTNAAQKQLTAESLFDDLLGFSLAVFLDIAEQAHAAQLPMFYDT